MRDFSLSESAFTGMPVAALTSADSTGIFYLDERSTWSSGQRKSPEARKQRHGAHGGPAVEAATGSSGTAASSSGSGSLSGRHHDMRGGRFTTKRGNPRRARPVSLTADFFLHEARVGVAKGHWHRD
jgi:hypothetical protein